MLYNILRNGLSAIFGDKIVKGLENSYIDPSGFNAEQAQLDRDWQEQMMHFQNAYNSPDQQMQRAREAGLNPSMLYGQPIATSVSPSGGAQASASAGFNPLDVIRSVQQGKLVNAQVDNLKSQADLMREQADTENTLREARLQVLVSQAKSNMANVSDVVSKIEQRVHQNALTDAEKNNISFEQMYKNNLLSIDYLRLKNETDLTQSQIDKNKADTQLALAKAKVTQREYDEMIWTYAIRAAGLSAQVGLTEAQTRAADSVANKLGLESTILTPEAINSQNWANNMSGMNGDISQIGSNVTYQLIKTISAIGGIILH